MKIEKFEDLEIWQEARALTKTIYSLTLSDPFNKDFKFRDQIRSSSGSVMDNIAEGFGRGGNKEFMNFLSIARGSIQETRSQVYRALDYNYITKDSFETLLLQTDSVSRKISKFISYLQNSALKGSKFI